ncbi:DUF2147 domain-containing protein [Paraglaciecola sp. 25GB23A]|uniref:DUF2147 domain-containing protein n=1 Tax=Paraglaciecola sp. 25GB23A TaxID=3156068 RepID=UPI0032AFBA62
MGSNYHLTANNWHEDYVYDPENGKTASAKMKPIDHSEKLEMRSYIDLPLFGRSANFPERNLMIC